MTTPTQLPLPAWVAVPSMAVIDVLWLAYGSRGEDKSATAGGIATAVTWVSGARAAPVTGRADSPVTRELAAAERMTAQLVVEQAAGLPPFPAQPECTIVGVAFVAPRAVSPDWAHGVDATLRWLLGRRGVEGPAPVPLILPARRADGSLATMEELYERALAAAALTPLPEQRREMRRQADRDATRSRRLDDRIRALQDAATRR